MEVAHHFDDVLLPRLKKAIHSPDWKAGKPISRDGVSQLIKYVRLESYEDTLDGLELTPPPSDLLALNTPLAEDYRLRYSLGSETVGSPCLLGADFADPFAYTLSVVRHGVRRDVTVDLPESFNYLIGLHVESRRMLGDVLATIGVDSGRRRCLVLWRNCEQVCNKALEAWFADNRGRFDGSFDVVYVNGDHTLNAIKVLDENWTAESIEPAFRELMFAESSS